MPPASATERSNEHRHPGFQQTRWSVIARAQGRDPAAAERALTELCLAYWYPVYSFVRRSGRGHHEAEDLTQGFLAHLIGGDGLAGVDRGKGKFRSFLLASAKNFLANERERAAARKRGGGCAVVSLDAAADEGRYLQEPADTATPESAYERNWALAVLGDTLNALRQEYVAAGKGVLFDALRGFLEGADPDRSYADAARSLQVSEGNVKSSVHRIAAFGAVLRAQVAHTVESDSEITKRSGT